MAYILNLRKKRWKESLQYSTLTIPALVIYGLFVVLPLLGAVYYSMTNWNGLSTEFDFIGLDNYVYLFTEGYVWHTLGTTLKYTISLTIIQNILAIVLAVALDQNIKTKNILRTMIFIVCTMSPLITGYVWSFIYSGPAMSMGKFFGIDAFAFNILSSEQWAIYAASFASIWRMTGWSMIIYLAGLQLIPRELYEAADVDGVSAIKKFFHITFPLLAPAITVNVILTFERGLKDFDSIFALTGGGPGDSTSIIALSIYRETFFFSRAGYGTAVGIILFLLIVISTIIQLSFLRKREEDVI